MSENAYYVDVDSIRRAFPPGNDAPSLLLDFAEGLEGCPWGNVGCFNLVGDFSDRAPIVDGSPLRDKFALFARLPEGSVVGAWYGAGHEAAKAPIVVLGSEGQHEIIAPSLEGWLARIALLWFETNQVWTDFTPHEDAEDATDELADWLRERLGVDDLEPLTQMPDGLPDFAGWMGKWCREREAYWEGHPAMAELAAKLTAHKPAGKDPWGRTIFEVAISGAQYQARVLRRGRQPIEEAAAIEPVLRALRDEMWRAKPELGLWHQMVLGMNASGCILPSFDYDTRPTFGEAPADISEAKADLLRAPRPERWVPAWLVNS
ncbi:hypothetical protein JQ628_05205 [Bradyrhizobium lablabi]|uniref:hypothetical protein n=1 Tax=Bradyrhizobium lablabi TaxID=722472 RepID=UPI001BA7B99E|nr:hypothetical protein [Bradyrhizobium lablabi]MBR1120905.1 hypothetical protein [Bradyrhizobium lablabi]